MTQRTARLPLSLCFLVAVDVAGCSVQSADVRGSTFEKEKSAVRAVVFRDLLRIAGRDDPCFLAFADGEGWVDPPDEFIRSLGLSRLTLRKASEAQLPKPGEMDPADATRYKGIRDPKTGKRAYLYYVQIDSISPNRARIKAGFTGGPLSGGGYESGVILEGDQWRILHDGPDWVN